MLAYSSDAKQRNVACYGAINIKSLLLGIPDSFIDHASREEMLEEAGLTADKIESKIKELM